MKRSLFWPIAGFALLTLVLGTVTQLWLVDRVIIPLETRESKARAEVVVATLAGELELPDNRRSMLERLATHYKGAGDKVELARIQVLLAPPVPAEPRPK